ncbi:MAG: tRNA-guanine transglycosylase, partial [bacterium]|nr:tRNA-guanine transglycosylase [bacterium]
MLPFEIAHWDSDTTARTAELTTPHGPVSTPTFMPVGTAGTVKGISAWDLKTLGPEMVLANTYHLLTRPGIDAVERMGGLHRLLAWDGPILTDSGGYQVFSLAARRSLDDDGATFRSHIDGSQHRLTPANVIQTQARLGVDVAMVLDECLPYPVDRNTTIPSVDRSVRWAVAGLQAATNLRESSEGSWCGGVFAIQQGSLFEDLRRECSERLSEHSFDGFALG